MCQVAPKAISRETTRLVHRYSRDQLGFSEFQVWYKLRAAKQSQLDAWKDKRMTGLRLSWRFENTPLILTSSEVGRIIETPNFGQKNFKKSYFERDHMYIAHLNFPKTLKDQMTDNREIVIQLESNMHQEEGWDETLTYTGESKKFTLVEEKKTWGEAEAFCQEQGGYLASIVSEFENEEVSKLADGEPDMWGILFPDAQKVWVGGNDIKQELELV